MKLRIIVALAVTLVLVLTASSGAGRAQQATSTVTIVGSIVDAHLDAVAGATVTLDRGGRTTASSVSDADGAFRFTKVTPGSYTVGASHAGYLTTTRPLRVATGVTTLHLPLVLMRPGDASPSADSAAPETRLGGAGQNNVPMDGVSPASPPATARVPSEVVNVTAAPPLIQAQGGERSFAVQSGQVENLAVARQDLARVSAMIGQPDLASAPPHSTERYAHAEPGRFHRALDDPLSTFGADVDTASFTNTRRFLQGGHLPPVDAVRVEEFVNYFRFAYPTPRSGAPIGVTTEVGDCPWAPGHTLVLIGARAIPSSTREVEGRNIVLLVDVSGSMSPSDKLPLIKSALEVFVDTLDPGDRLAIVTYAGTSGVALPSTEARDRSTILTAIDRLHAGGSTNGAQGLILAYRLARQHFVAGGVNRVILATDGDFNVGIVDRRDLLHLIEREKNSGVFLSVFGVGTGNLKDATMEMLADHGNGHYAYLDSMQEARRVLVTEGDSTLETVAKDVKFQVEFNPARVSAWKLIGYENRLMPAEDFNDDRKDGGELGAGHTVTVLYEVVPAGVPVSGDAARPIVNPLKYQTPESPATRRTVSTSNEWLTVKVRYQPPDGDQSRLIEQAVPAAATATPTFLPFASAVAEFGLLLRDDAVAPGRWDALARRIGRMTVPVQLEADRAQVAELVELARALRRTLP